jgi:hypothetical protein
VYRHIEGCPLRDISRHRAVLPPGTSKDDLGGALQCKAISLVSSADEQTEQKYHFCEAVASAGKKYFPSELANGLLPGQAETLRSSSPFRLPYRPPNKETLQSKRFLFFGAKGPITNVAVPVPSAEQ